MTAEFRWVTVEQAAEQLGCSARTVERRLAAGRLESRLDGSGRRRVRVAVSRLSGWPTDTAGASDADRQTDAGGAGSVSDSDLIASSVAEATELQRTLAATTISSERQRADLAERYTDNMLIEVRAARRGRNVAAAAAVVLAGVAVTVGAWTLQARAEADREAVRLQAAVDAASALAASARSEADRTRQDSAQAIERADRRLSDMTDTAQAERDRADRLAADLADNRVRLAEVEADRDRLAERVQVQTYAGGPFGPDPAEGFR